MTYGTVPRIAPSIRGGAEDGVPAPAKAGTDSLPSKLPHDRSPATGFVIELPLPPSVNSYVKKLGNMSPGVRKWRMLCDSHLFEHWRWLKGNKVTGPFLIDITWTSAEMGKSDIDNRIKPLLDYLQEKGLVENDKLCREMRVGFGETKFGCRVEVLPRRVV